MRYGKGWIGLLSAVLTITALLFWFQEPEPKGHFEAAPSVPFSVEITTGETTRRISCWRREDGKYFVFLPSGVQLEEAFIRMQDQKEVYVNQKKLTEGQSCEGFVLGQPMSMTFSRSSTNRDRTVTFVQSEGLPAMYIDVSSGNMDYIHAVKGNEESGRLRIMTPEGNTAYSGNLRSIRGRGNYTWTKDKKPYSMTLTAPADLLGMGSAEEWILLSNPVDPSHLRNKFVYDFAREAGMPYSPESRWVELYLNGSYVGIYLLSERNEIHPQRVALDPQNSFLVSMEAAYRLQQQGYAHISTEQQTALRIHHSSLEAEALQALWQSAENAVFAPDGIDPVTGKHWLELIDLDSWVRKYLIEELFGSVDAGAISQYFYGTPDSGKLFAGPVWDYDVAMGNTKAWQLAYPEAFFANRAVQNLWMGPTWFHGLYQKPEFYDRVVQLYREEYRPLLETWLDTELDACFAYLETAAALDELRWQLRPFREEVALIRDYMTRRMAFLDSLWLEGEAWLTVLADMAEGSNTVCIAVRPGETLPALRDLSYVEDALGWYHRSSSEPVDLTQPVTEDLDIYVKYREEEPSVPAAPERLPLLPPLLLGGMLIFLLAWDSANRRKAVREKSTAPQI